MVKIVKVKSVYGEESIRVPKSISAGTLMNDHLRRFGIKGQGPLCAILLDGVVLFPRATLEELALPDDVTLTVVLMRATAI